MKSDWHRVVFSDESCFELFPCQKVLVCQASTKKYCIHFLVSAVPQGDGSVIVWDCIMSEGPGQLQIVKGTINSGRCIKTMKNYMLPSVHRLLGENFIYQQDNATCHT